MEGCYEKKGEISDRGKPRERGGGQREAEWDEKEKRQGKRKKNTERDRMAKKGSKDR